MLQKFRALLLSLLLTHCTMLLAQTDSSVFPKPFGQGTYVPSKFGSIFYEADVEGKPVVMINGEPTVTRTVFWRALDFLKPHDFQRIYFDESGGGRATREILKKFSPAITVEDIKTLRKH